MRLCPFFAKLISAKLENFVRINKFRIFLWEKNFHIIGTVWEISFKILGDFHQIWNTIVLKPSRKKLQQAAAAMNLDSTDVAMVGDRLFTDIVAGNRLGMFTVLVDPMVDPAIAERAFPIRNFEVWLTQKLGISLVSDRT